MCSDKENPTNGCRTTPPGAEGVGTRRALDGFAKWSREVYLPGGELSFTSTRHGKASTLANKFSVCGIRLLE